MLYLKALVNIVHVIALFPFILSVFVFVFAFVIFGINNFLLRESTEYHKIIFLIATNYWRDDSVVKRICSQVLQRIKIQITTPKVWLLTTSTLAAGMRCPLLTFRAPTLQCTCIERHRQTQFKIRTNKIFLTTGYDDACL